VMPKISAAARGKFGHKRFRCRFKNGEGRRPRHAPDGVVACIQTAQPTGTQRGIRAAGCCLRRYGWSFAICWRGRQSATLARIADWFPPVEDRGEVRGGRFVDGFQGEPVRLPVASIVAREPQEIGSRVSVSGPGSPMQAAGKLRNSGAPFKPDFWLEWMRISQLPATAS